MAKGKDMTTTLSHLSGQIYFGVNDNFNIKSNKI